jgi:hypothetical protein
MSTIIGLSSLSRIHNVTGRRDGESDIFCCSNYFVVLIIIMYYVAGG